ncbi:hypothetical protein [uncultured Tissierella sp.]|uniref:hypothetical protein n=1 Tax=uncultured Tissierella sp. TaxID=448160 RepID=UPI002804AAB1|nr:hypothetical protein [uncultured Tissierella sp.]MDU5081226.1 hypothetical protein [Bacillota bacterium]
MINVKLNFDNQFTDLEGCPLNAKMDDTLANILALSSEGDPQKMISWAMSLINYGEIDVDKKEIMYLKEFVIRNSLLSNLAKDQLIDKLDKGLNGIE